MKYLSHYTEQATTEALESNNAFFAFNQDQFFKHREPGVKYVSLKAGLICPKGNVKKLLDDLDAARINGIKKDVQENDFKAIIRREYFNHETQITMDNQSVVAVLSEYIQLFPETFTIDSILEVCGECFKEAVEQDLF